MLYTSQVFTDLEEKRVNAANELKELINHYEEASMPEIMSTSSKIFQDLRDCTKADERVIYPHVCEKAKRTELLECTKELHVDILNALDELLFIHVDEPNNDYIDRLRELYTLVQSELYRTHNVVYPLAQNVLDRHEMKEIESELEQIA